MKYGTKVNYNCPNLKRNFVYFGCRPPNHPTGMRNKKETGKI